VLLLLLLLLLLGWVLKVLLLLLGWVVKVLLLRHPGICYSGVRGLHRHERCRVREGLPMRLHRSA
jgi:hypothetical protein